MDRPLRARHRTLRKTDPGRSQPYRPWHTFNERQPLESGVPVDVDIEIWPFSVLIAKGYRLGVSVLGRDFEFAGDGPEFRGTTTLDAGGARGRLLLPFLEPGV